MTSEDSFESYYVLGTLFRNDRPGVTTCWKQLRDKLSSSNQSVQGRLERCIGGQSFMASGTTQRPHLMPVGLRATSRGGFCRLRMAMKVPAGLSTGQQLHRHVSG